MGGGQRIAAVAAVSHARHNRTESDAQPYDSAHFNANVFFASATLCGLLVAVCLTCWRRFQSTKPDTRDHIYSVSAHIHAATLQRDDSLGAASGPPPAYDVVVDKPPDFIKPDDTLEGVISEPCPRCHAPAPVRRTDSGLPSYEAAVLLKDTKL